jgi:hypothetical protein
MRTSTSLVLYPAIVLGIMGVLVGGYAMLLVAMSETKVVETTHRGVDTLVVTAHSSDIELVQAPAGADLRVTRHVTEGFAAPRRDESFAGGRLELDYACEALPVDRCGTWSWT